MQWYIKRPSILKKEKQILMDKYPLLEQFSYVNSKNIVVEGCLDLIINNEKVDNYKVRIVFPSDYPNNLPVLFEIDEKIPRKPFRHINDNGSCCLGPNLKIWKDWKKNSNIDMFITSFVIPFLANQTYFERNGEWAGGEYAHGAKGVLQYYQELTGFSDVKTIKVILKSILSGIPIGRNEPCFCDSKEKLKNCHLEMYNDIKSIGNHDIFKADFLILNSGNDG
jgi:hypothetical protein